MDVLEAAAYGKAHFQGFPEGHLAFHSVPAALKDKKEGREGGVREKGGSFREELG